MQTISCGVVSSTDDYKTAVVPFVYLPTATATALNVTATATATKINPSATAKPNLEKTPSFEYMSFSGGGFKGFSFLGAIDYLEAFHFNLVKRCKGHSGTSIGALIALALNIGCSSTKLKKMIQEQSANMDLLQNINLSQFLAGGSLVESTVILDPIVKLLKAFIGDHNITFAGLFNRTGRQLSICVSNVTQSKIQYHSYLQTPHIRVADSVLASMAFPGVFAPVEMEHDTFIDGGVGDNFPIDCFPLDRTLGFCLCSKSDLVYDHYYLSSSKNVAKTPEPDSPEPTKGLTRTFNIISSIIKMQMDRLSYCRLKMYADSIVREHVVFIDTQDAQTISDFPTSSMQSKLIQNGYQQTRLFFDSNHFIPK